MTNKRTLKIGYSDFKSIIENNGYFVDKTLLIKDFFESNALVLLIPRPRRFGKTLNLSMIEHFFDINRKDSAKLFSEFEISEKKEFCEQYQNTYPVINFNLKRVKASSWNDCFDSLITVISELYQKHNYLLKSDNLEIYEKQIIEKLILRTASEIEYKLSLRYLSKYLKTHFEKDVIILVDEYDTPIIYSYEATFGKEKEESNKKYYSKTIDFMRTFLGEAFKGNENLQKGLITGIMRIARESIFSELNNFKVFSITSPYFADKFGFTESETKKLLHYFNLYDSYQNVQKWYNGYKFGNTDGIYNPWSIVNYVEFKDEGFKPHWVNTGSDMLIRERITKPDIENTLQKLIAGDTIEKTISETFIFSDFENKDELLWTLLLHSGYLTHVKETYDDTYELKIPNFEIKRVFKNIILYWIESEYKFKKDLLISTTRHLINNRIKEFEQGFKQIIGDTMSYFDTAGEPEKVYQAYTLGLLAVLSDDYMIKSNRESGQGRYDIMLIPNDKTKYGVVIEIKQIKVETLHTTSLRERINSTIKQALNQINKNKYYRELIENKIKPENIIKIPIVFARKEPYILPF